MSRRTKNLLTWLLVIVVVIITTILTQLILFTPNKQVVQTIEASQVVNEKIRTWNSSDTYVKGDKVTFKGKIYEAKWWTKGEQPDLSDEWGVWKVVAAAKASADNLPNKTGTQNFKVVGYYPDWQPDKINDIQYDKLTHINYAFAIPREDGSLRPLENPQAAKAIIAEAHRHGVKVLLAIGGWAYKEVPLESTFKAATETDQKCKKLANSISEMVKEFGFDGADIDWEHPRNGETSSNQYAKLIQNLSELMKNDHRLLTVAVLPGKTADGTIQYDAAAQSDEVISNVDWINVMAYDGGDGNRHSSYEFAIDCASYWKDIRKVTPYKIVLGVPFYGRPLWAPYNEIIKVDADAAYKDTVTMQGSQVYYNGIPTIKKKTKWAINNIGGIMIWEISQDTINREESLLNAIDASI